MSGCEQREAVIRMQDHIHAQVEAELRLEDICAASLYSARHARRLFCELLGITPTAYVRELRLARSALRLLERRRSETVADIAFASGFQSPEGYAKAFRRRYGVLPHDYRRGPLPGERIPRPMSSYYLQLRSRGKETRSKMRTVTATFYEKPAACLIIRRSTRATDYFSYCDEVGCEIWDILTALPGRCDEVALLHLPPSLTLPGGSAVCVGVEVPADAAVSLPPDCERITAPAQLTLCLQSQPYTDPDGYGPVHEEVTAALAAHDPARFGYRYAHDEGIEYQFSASPANGVRRLIPVAALHS
ncbi:MAG: helix-turn-helix transcriptional regulator [Bacillota bacterium]|nr:helix-turn-helix transcriptional regulator [Bacillota bacterium]